MPRLCTVCTHPQRQAIDLALVLRSTAIRRIVERYGLSDTSLRRHMENHLAISLELSKELGAMLSAENLTHHLSQWHERMETQYSNADAAGNILAAVATARTGIAAIESFAKLGVMSELEARVEALEQEHNETEEEDNEWPPDLEKK